jgi:hypothetical protein
LFLKVLSYKKERHLVEDRLDYLEALQLGRLIKSQKIQGCFGCWLQRQLRSK